MTEFNRIKFARQLRLVLNECQRQYEKWGEQNHPNNTGAKWAGDEQFWKLVNAQNESSGTHNWRHILSEEVAEAMASSTKEHLEEELIQVAAVCMTWIDALDRQK